VFRNEGILQTNLGSIDIRNFAEWNKLLIFKKGYSMEGDWIQISWNFEGTNIKINSFKSTSFFWNFFWENNPNTSDLKIELILNWTNIWIAEFKGLDGITFNAKSNWIKNIKNEKNCLTFEWYDQFFEITEKNITISYILAKKEETCTVIYI